MSLLKLTNKHYLQIRFSLSLNLSNLRQDMCHYSNSQYSLAKQETNSNYILDLAFPTKCCSYILIFSSLKSWSTHGVLEIWICATVMMLLLTTLVSFTITNHSGLLPENKCVAFGLKFVLCKGCFV